MNGKFLLPYFYFRLVDIGCQDTHLVIFVWHLALTLRYNADNTSQGFDLPDSRQG